MIDSELKTKATAKLQEEIEKELKKKTYKLLTITHVDTSTGVLVNPKPIAELAIKYEVIYG